jgi:hypothetical protein
VLAIVDELAEKLLHRYFSVEGRYPHVLCYFSYKQGRRSLVSNPTRYSTIPCCRELLNSLHREGTTIAAVFLRSLAGISSGLVAFGIEGTEA